MMSTLQRSIFATKKIRSQSKGSDLISARARCSLRIRKEEEKVKQLGNGLIILTMLVLFISCVTAHPGRYNTQRGAAIGAGIGALSGGLIGRNTRSAFIGAGVGTLLGAVVGNAVDQHHQIAREAALTNRRVIYYHHKNDHAIEAIPGAEDQHTKCRKVTMREWDKGNLDSEKVEEVCEGEKLFSTY